MILSDAEIRAIQARHPTDNDPTDFAHAIIAATVAKLAAGVSVETHYIYTEWISPGERVSMDMFNRDQLQTAIAAARVAALTEAEQVVLADCVPTVTTEYQRQYNITLQSTAGSIRALIEKEST
jgi:hypothetical protein